MGRDLIRETANVMRQRLEWHIDKAGSLRALASKWSVSAAFLSDIRLGRRYPGVALRKRLGILKVIEKPKEPTYYATKPFPGVRLAPTPENRREGA